MPRLNALLMVPLVLPYPLVLLTLSRKDVPKELTVFVFMLYQSDRLQALRNVD